MNISDFYTTEQNLPICIGNKNVQLDKDTVVFFSCGRLHFFENDTLVVSQPGFVPPNPVLRPLKTEEEFKSAVKFCDQIIGIFITFKQNIINPDRKYEDVIKAFRAGPIKDAVELLKIIL